MKLSFLNTTGTDGVERSSFFLILKSSELLSIYHLIDRNYRPMTSNERSPSGPSVRSDDQIELGTMVASLDDQLSKAKYLSMHPCFLLILASPLT